MKAWEVLISTVFPRTGLGRWLARSLVLAVWMTISTVPSFSAKRLPASPEPGSVYTRTWAIQPAAGSSRRMFLTS